MSPKCCCKSESTDIIIVIQTVIKQLLLVGLSFVRESWRALKGDPLEGEVREGGSIDRYISPGESAGFRRRV
jgi:hypothetical protein